MKRVETRVQQVMAAVGALLALAVFTPALFAEDPLPTTPPSGSNYPGYNNNLTWQESGGAGTVQPGKICAMQAACLAPESFCYSPYNATFDGTPYQSMNRLQAPFYGLCQFPMPGSNPEPDCIQKPTVICASVRLWEELNCQGDSTVRLVYHKDACN